MLIKIQQGATKDPDPKYSDFPIKTHYNLSYFDHYALNQQNSKYLFYKI